jgi:hypothetical protein
MVMLSDVALTNGLMWTDRWGPQDVAQTMLRTLGGLPVFYSAKLNKGVSVTLESLPDQGWQTLETVTALYELASVAGAQYLLDFGPIQFSVMFRHNDGPAFEATPLIPRTLADAGDHFTIKLKLVTV